MAEPVTYQLVEPLTVTAKGPEGERTETVATLTVHPLVKAKDLRCLDGVDGGKVAMGIALIAHCCRIPRAQADELGLADFAALSEIVEGFLPAGLKTGATP